MHKQILEHATPEQIKEFATDFITMLKATQPELYNEAEDWLYKEVYGCHFNEWSLNKALNNMVNEDGSVGQHWSLDQTTQLLNQYNYKFNKYDWCYTMNMIYSDYYGVVDNDTTTYVRISEKFLCDKDAPDGKAYIYYRSMTKGSS